MTDEMSTILSEAEAAALYAAGDAAHDFDHVRRVARLAVRLAEAEGADVTVVRLAALLHDAPTPGAEAGGRSSHHRSAAAFARRLLLERGLDAERADAVAHCIEAHRFRDHSTPPQTLEAKCLYDADKLDSMGAIGIARAFAYGGAHADRLWTEPWRRLDPQGSPPAGAEYTPVHEYVYKLNRLLATLHTDSARALGAERHVFMAHFFDRLDVEMDESDEPI